MLNTDKKSEIFFDDNSDHLPSGYNFTLAKFKRIYKSKEKYIHVIYDSKGEFK